MHGSVGWIIPEPEKMVGKYESCDMTYWVLRWRCRSGKALWTNHGTLKSSKLRGRMLHTKS